MFGLKEYVNDDESIDTYYSHEAVSEETVEEEMEEEYENYENYENYDMNEVPYKTKPVEKEVPKAVWRTPIPEVSPWATMSDLDENVTKSLVEIMEEEKNKEEMLKKKKQEDEEKKSKFKRTKHFNFKNNNNKSNNGSLLLGMKNKI